MFLVVLECLKDRAFHIQTVYVNSLDPNGIVWGLGNPQFRNGSRMVSWHGRIQGGGPGGPDPPFLTHDVGFLTLGPKFDPLLDPPPPFFACRPKMDTPFSKIMDPPLVGLF